MMTIISPRWSVNLILILAGTLTQVADCCFHNCCCRDRDIRIDCRNATFSPLPPLPDVHSRWCGDEIMAPEADKITTIRLSDTSIDHINKDVFKAYPNLKILDVRNCKFKVLGPDTFPVSGNASLIEEINLQYNEIESIHEDAFKGLPRLKSLYLTGNSIVTLPLNVFKSLPELKTLWLNKNRISDLKTSIFASLLSNLNELDLSSNPLKNLQQFSSLSITILKLSNVSISELRQDVFSELKSLEILDLSFNKMTYLLDDVFFHNRHLRTIYLNDNRFSVIGKETFSNLCFLRLLDLRHNRLTIVHSQWFASVVNNSVDRTTWKTEDVIKENPANQGNPLDCDGEGVEIREYAYFLTRICEDDTLKPIELLEYLNIACSSGQVLVDKTCKSTARSLTTKEKSEILSRNTGAKCMNGTETPECPFLSSTCAFDQEPARAINSEPLTAQMSLSPFVLALIAITITVALIFLAFHALRRRAEKRQRFTSGSSENSEASSFYKSESSCSITSDTDDATPLDVPQPTLRGHQASQHPQPDQIRPCHNQHILPRQGRHTAVTSGFWEYHPPDVRCSFGPNPDPFNLQPHDSFSFPNSDTSRPAPIGSSQCNSTAPSITSRDINDTSSLRSGFGSATSSTDPKELVNPFIDTPNTVPKSVCESDGTQPKSLLHVEETVAKDLINYDDTIPKDLVNSHETIPKEPSQSAETRPKKHLHLQSQPNAGRGTNTYGATPTNHPQRDPKANESPEPEYTLMSQQCPISSRPPIPPRRSAAANQGGAQNLPNPTHLTQTQPPSSQCPSCHNYCSIISQNPWPAPPPPNLRPPIPPPPYCLNPNCYLHYPSNPVHLPYIVYRDITPVGVRPRSDQQPLLPDTETSKNEKNKKKKEDKKKTPKRK